MAAEARVSPRWVVRTAVVIVITGLYGLWCLYDGLVAYPRRNAQIDAYQRHLHEDRLADWEVMAAERGWAARPDLNARKSNDDIAQQFLMLAICGVIGLPAVLRLLWAWPRKMAADDSGFVNVRGVRIPYAAIRTVDKSKWNSKSIAVVHYELDGVRGKTTIDDWIFRGGAAVLAEIEARLPGAEVPGLRHPDGADEDGESHAREL